MEIGFIGAGKVGFSLSKYFSINKETAHIELSGFYSRNLSSSIEASEFTSSHAFDNIEDLISKSELIFITVPDDEIANIWGTIKKYNIKDKIICHTSGSISSEVFENIESYGAFGYSVHPMFPFSDKYNTYKSLNKCYFTIEGSKEKLHILTHIFNKVGNKTLIIDNSKKALYHLANVTVSNLVLSLINKGCTYLGECGIDSELCIEALMPLIRSNIDNIKNKGFLNSLTGPIERNDTGTVQKHIKVINKNDLSLYKNLSDNLLMLSHKKHPERNMHKLKELLK